MPQLRKWYFALNDAGFRRVRPQWRVAVASARANTALRPICLYNGTEAAHIDELTRAGVEVVRHTSSVEPALRKGYGDKYDVFSGHWLRIDIPLIETEDDVVLYTDIDVMFLRQPRVRWRPRYLAAAPERYRLRLRHFNSGVLVMNVPALRRVHDAFRAAIAARFETDYQPRGQDQISYNAFFRHKRGFLDHAMNWKPYWGVNPRARIVHFHGPKPKDVRRIVRDPHGAPSKPYVDLWRLNPAAYAHYAGLFDAYLAQSRRQVDGAA